MVVFQALVVMQAPGVQRLQVGMPALLAVAATHQCPALIFKLPTLLK